MTPPAKGPRVRRGSFYAHDRQPRRIGDIVQGILIEQLSDSCQQSSFSYAGGAQNHDEGVGGRVRNGFHEVVLGFDQQRVGNRKVLKILDSHRGWLSQEIAERGRWCTHQNRSKVCLSGSIGSCNSGGSMSATGSRAGNAPEGGVRP